MRTPRLTVMLSSLAILAAGADSPPGTPAPPKGYVCHRAVGPITLDGRLDDPSWARAPWTDPFVDIEGNLKPLPRFKTRAKMTWDDNAFYIAAELREPDVWGTITKHDAVIFHDNDFEVFIDPDGDNHDYAEFEMNVLNTGWDLFLPKPYRDGGPAIDSFELDGIRTAVTVDGTLNRAGDSDGGWTVEIAIPWASMAKFAHKACPPVEGDFWRVNFSRVEWKHRVVDGKYEKIPGLKEDNWVWSPQGVVDMHRPERWGYVQFTRREPGEVRYRDDPSGPGRDRLMDVYHAQRSYQAKNKRWATSVEELGLDPKRYAGIAIRPNGEGYEATTVVPAGVGEVRDLTLSQDSRLLLGPIRPRPAGDR